MDQRWHTQVQHAGSDQSSKRLRWVPKQSSTGPDQFENVVAPLGADRSRSEDWSGSAKQRFQSWVQQSSTRKALSTKGFAIFPGALSSADTGALRLALPVCLEGGAVRMSEQRKGDGEYDYLRHLPPLLADIREFAYEALVPLAHEFLSQHCAEVQAVGKPFDLGQTWMFPEHLEQFEDLCRSKGQTRPSCLLLRYGEGGENRAHRDVYGDVSFPLQMLIMLSEPGTDFSGGEFFTLVDRQEHRAHIRRGDVLVFRTSCKHGCKPVRRGHAAEAERHVVGLQFALRQLRRDRLNQQGRR